VLKDEEEEDGNDKGGEDKPVVNPLEDKEPVLNPPEPVPVRLDSQPLESASSQGSAEGQNDKADKTKVIHCTLFFIVKYESQKMCRLTIVKHVLALLVLGAFTFCSLFVLWAPMLP